MTLTFTPANGNCRVNQLAFLPRTVYLEPSFSEILITLILHYKSQTPIFPTAAKTKLMVHRRI
jgi:hypothetical protein